MAESDKRTPVFDYEAGDFVKDSQGAVKTVTEGAAVEQIVVKALNTVRGVYLIYANLDGDLNHKYGNDTKNILKQDISEEVRMAEVKRAIYEALIYDPWITDVYDINISREPDGVQEGKEVDAAYLSCVISTIFDKDITLDGVNLNG